MDWHFLAATLAVLFAFAAPFPYIRDIIGKQTRPNIVSWFIWALTVGISAAAQFSAEPSWSLALVAATFVLDVAVLVLASLYGYAKFKWWDGVCLALSVLAILLWLLSGNALVALGFAITADGLGFVPTYIKSWREPLTETPTAWFLYGMSGFFGILAAGQFDFASIGFSLYYFLACGILWLLILARRQVKKP